MRAFPPPFLLQQVYEAAFEYHGPLPLAQAQGEFKAPVLLLHYANYLVGFLDRRPEPLERERVSLGELRVIRGVAEDKGEYAEVHEVRPVYAREALRYLYPYAQIARRYGRVLARGALPVVLPAHHYAAAGFGAPLAEEPVYALEGELAYLRDVRPEGQHPVARREDVVCRDVVAG